ncbi:MAG: SpoIIE family protein phosphatase [Bacteroidia bacterium]|nr:SpoIIE family protein phosphatase [Bacteroidia bacterium]
MNCGLYIMGGFLSGNASPPMSTGILDIIAVAAVATGILIWLVRKLVKMNQRIAGFQHIFNHTNDALMLIDIVDGKIIYANHGSVKLLGYTLENLCQKTIFDLHERDQLARSSEIIARVYEEKGLIYSDLPFVSAAGEKIAVECSARVEDFEGKPVIFISARDIRERLKMQEQIKAQSTIIEQKNKDLIDSITYAKNIQSAILPSLTAMQKAFKDMFVLYIPKDIVSGDFYWYASLHTTNSTDLAAANTPMDIVASVDCTGHGVPGAFMSLVGYTLLNQTVNMPDVNTPADVIDFMHRELVNTLNKKKDEIVINDGMDMSVCAIDQVNNKLIFAGANHELFHVRNGKLEIINGDKQAIGIQSIENYKPYTNHSLDLQKGDTIYLFTDGFQDQFGGEKNKKYRGAKLREFLMAIQHKSMPEQKELLKQEFDSWKGINEQVDDVLIIGIRL